MSETENEAVDTFNLLAVGVRGDSIVILAPRNCLTKREALVHAAFLVALADDNDEFDKILKQVCST